MKKYKVYLSPLAERKLLILLDYLAEEWGDTSRDKFLKKFKSSVDAISSYPYSCIQSSIIQNLFKCVVNKYSSFYYRINENDVEIITIIDNRQDQIKLLVQLKNYFRIK